MELFKYTVEIDGSEGLMILKGDEKSSSEEGRTIFSERQSFNEMATVCAKNDGYGMIIEVYSEDHGILGSKTSPAHAHLKATDNKYLGKFAITNQPPRSSQYVFDCDKNYFIPPEYKEKIVNWSKNKYQDMEVSNWAALKLSWKILHP
jgi:hypothetical protein